MGDTDALVRVKLGADGGELVVSEKAPKIIRLLFPPSWFARRRANYALIDRVVAKLESGVELTPAEVGFAEENLGPEISKYSRLKRIAERGVVVFRELEAEAPKPALPPTDDEGDAPDPGVAAKAETSPDLINKLREDASLVDDEVIGEIYARLIAGEARAPGSYSLSTLRVLRYLDASAAEVFGRVCPYASQFGLPGRDGFKDEYERIEVGYVDFLELGDAGLLHAIPSAFTPEAAELRFDCPRLDTVFRVRKKDGQPVKIFRDVNLLTRAGKELSRLSPIQKDLTQQLAIARWLAHKDESLQIDMGTPGTSGWIPAPIYPL